MLSEKARISENGRIVVPAAIRQALGLKGGENLTVSLDEFGIHLQTQRQAIAEARAAVRKYVGAGRCLSDELIAERRLEAAREERGA